MSQRDGWKIWGQQAGEAQAIEIDGARSATEALLSCLADFEHVESLHAQLDIPPEGFIAERWTVACGDDRWAYTVTICGDGGLNIHPEAL